MDGAAAMTKEIKLANSDRFLAKKWTLLRTKLPKVSKINILILLIKCIFHRPRARLNVPKIDTNNFSKH